VANGPEVGAVAPCPAGGVEDDTERQAVEDLAHDRLLEVDQLVPRFVIELGPTAISLCCRDWFTVTRSPSSLDGI
jgi:hypothetical protein